MALNAQNNKIIVRKYMWQKLMVVLDKPLPVSQYNPIEMTAGNQGCLT